MKAQMMKTFLRTIITAAGTVAMSLMLGSMAYAQQPLLQKTQLTQTLPTRATQTYGLVLSLGNNWNTDSSGLPDATVKLDNPGRYTLKFFLEDSLSQFTVEYKATESDAAPNTKWKMLKSDRQPLAPSISVPEKPAGTSTFRVLISVFPGKQYGYPDVVSGFPMSAKGLYRITAFTEIPNVAELSGSKSSQKVVRMFDLNVRSNSVVIRRTTTGFVEVLSATDKPAAVKQQ